MTHGRPDPRAGHTLAEAIVALLLAGVLTACLAGTMNAIGRLSRTHERVSTHADTERVVAAVLAGELRALTLADAVFDSDSVRLRAFRGAGIVCAAHGRELAVRYRGVRRPEPDKDSVLLIWPSGELSRALKGVDARGSCPTTSDGVLRMFVDSGPAFPSASPAVALVFETGAYSFGGAALRYRRGAGGRQPLTEASLSSGTRLTRIDLGGTGASAAAIALLPSGMPGTGASAASRAAPAVSWRVVMPQGESSPGHPER